MPPPQTSACAASPASRQRTQLPAQCRGQVIEYIRDRLYLASYTQEPDHNTPFPYTADAARPSQHTPKTRSADTTVEEPPVYFSIDNTLLYNAFYADFGPLHIGHLYRFAVELHEVLGHPDNQNRKVVFWSYADSRSRANSACILACYMILIQSWPPHLALAPIAQMDPPLMPFRDAGYSQADYMLSIQDVVYGVWKAKEEGLCGLDEFNLEEYEKFERVDMGDFNWITPHFVALASPQHQPIAPVPRASPEFAALPKTSAEIMATDLPQPFKNVLTHFRRKHVGLIVRLNSELYSPSYFEAAGIAHRDMIFDDGTCPPLHTVKHFIKMAHDMITKKNRKVAVHCKAGLGRTGCLIGAYLIYRHGFTANEVIAYMRFMRPGMVVGPQQHWLHLNQGTFRQWCWEDTMREKAAQLKPSTPTRTTMSQTSNGQTHTPPTNGSAKRRALGELDCNDNGVSRRESAVAGMHDNLPAPTPGQPRKTSKLYGERQSVGGGMENDTSFLDAADAELMALQGTEDAIRNESADDLRAKIFSAKPSSAQTSPSKPRAISCYTTLTTHMEWTLEEDDAFPTAAGNKLARSPSGNAGTASGSGGITVGKQRGSPVRREAVLKSGVRKTSGRVGSAGAVAHATKVKQ